MILSTRGIVLNCLQDDNGRGDDIGLLGTKVLCPLEDAKDVVGSKIKENGYDVG